MLFLQATVPSWAPSDAPFVWDTTATSVTLGWPEPASNGGNVTGYEVRACSDVAAECRHNLCWAWAALRSAPSWTWQRGIPCMALPGDMPSTRLPPAACQVEMDDGSGFRHVARAAERQCTVEGLRSGILYK